MSNDRAKVGIVLGRAARRLALGLLVAVGVGACGGVMGALHRGPARPAASEFGFGPRTSAGGRFQATLEPEQPLRVGRMQTVRLRLRDAAGQPLDGAAITVDGGMPQHGHGLPTRPRVTRALGAGTYQVDGVKFNMGGWWELKFRIATAAGADSVTFNLDL
ncbi:MAG: FixH family protein [Gemmatimonadetes bacterium]|nr:FixH family protein [Gemmatimonadota bacterium]